MVGAYLTIWKYVFEKNNKFSENNRCLVEYASFSMPFHYTVRSAIRLFVFKIPFKKGVH